MKFAIDYLHENIDILSKFDEVFIDYRNDLEEIITYIKDNPDKRCIINIDDKDACLNMELINNYLDIRENNNINFSIKFKAYYDGITEILDKIKGKIPFFFNIYINDWDMLHGYIKLGVSDIYIVESMCFELDKVAAIVHDANIQIRCFGNVAQSRSGGLSAIKKFFIRPEDVKFYDKYIDVIEFFGTKEQKSVAIDYYRDSMQWFGDLNEIIINFNDNVDSRFIVREFAPRRIKCGKKCLKGGKCDFCDTVVKLSKTLKEAGIMVKIEENKEEDIDGKADN